MAYLLQHLLTESAEKYPDHKAVVFEDRFLTYQELDQVSNKLAALLVRHGVSSGDRVGIFINKSIPSIVSIYGILKAGAVYVPLDPLAPESRISYIINDCDIKFLLTSTAKANSIEQILVGTSSLQVVIFTDEDYQVKDLPVSTFTWTDVHMMSGDRVVQNFSNHSDLAYILYTSGSTGLPKGVMISHLNSLTFVNWAFDEMRVSHTDRFSSHAPLHFDLSIFDIFVAAKSGGSLFLVPETLSIFPTRLSSWISEKGITVWYSVPSILSMMVLHGQLEDKDFAALRLVIFAGEVFPVKFLRALMKVIPHPEYYNLYGPTETNVITYYKVPLIPEHQTAPIPIGRCCENMGVFALTDSGTIVASPEEEGELMARGTCVAQGYWGDQQKSDRVFVRNPLQKNYYDRAYKTGDLVSVDEQGNYVYKGRIDQMIKSRGYRIEIGEIETAIYSHELVKEVAVIAIPDDLITNRIKAVIVKSSDGLSVSDIKAYCTEKLPKYMIPEVIEFRESLPKTSTGKVDKPAIIKNSIPQ